MCNLWRYSRIKLKQKDSVESQTTTEKQTKMDQVYWEEMTSTIRTNSSTVISLCKIQWPWCRFIFSCKYFFLFEARFYFFIWAFVKIDACFYFPNEQRLFQWCTYGPLEIKGWYFGFLCFKDKRCCTDYKASEANMWFLASVTRKTNGSVCSFLVFCIKWS